MHRLPDLLRASRSLLGLKQAHVDAACGFSARTVFKLEAETHVRLPRTALTLQSFYEAKGVEFIDAVEDRGSGIRWRVPVGNDPTRSKMFRAARALADLSQENLAKLAGIDENFVNRLEKDALKQINKVTLEKLEAFLGRKNVEITPQLGGHGAGVRYIKVVNTPARALRGRKSET